MPKKIDLNELDITHENVEFALKYADDILGGVSDEELIMIERFKQLDVYKQDIFAMRAEGLSLREIGDKLDVSYTWVRDRLNEINIELGL